MSHKSFNDFAHWVYSDANKVLGTCINAPSESSSYYIPHRFLELYWCRDRIRSFLGPLNVPIDKIQDKYLRTFSTLIFISTPDANRSGYIEEFLSRDSIDDHNLPFEEASLRHFSFAGTPAGKETIRNFCKHQFQFCPVSLTRPHNQQLQSGCILPITRGEKLAGDQSNGAILWKYTLQESSGLNIPSNTIVVKEFYPSELEYSRAKEISAYTALRNKSTHSDIILDYYGSFIQNDKGVILLEYADRGTLLDIFKQGYYQPCTREELYRFWSGLTELFNGVAIIHNLDGDSFGMGIHQDLKPSNIFVFSSQDGYLRFKIGDFSLSSINFIKRETRTEDCHPDNKATKVYGAPELTVCHGQFDHLDSYITNDADNWSLAAVLLEAAIWSVCGEKGRDEFLEARQAETRGMVVHCQQGYGSSFHDGIRALRAVGEMRTKILERKRVCDDVTEPITLFIIKDLLLPKEEKRLSAQMAFFRLRNLLDQCQLPPSSLPHSLSPIDENFPVRTFPQEHHGDQHGSSSFRRQFPRKPSLSEDSPNNTDPGLSTLILRGGYRQDWETIQKAPPSRTVEDPNNVEHESNQCGVSQATFKHGLGIPRLETVTKANQPLITAGGSVREIRGHDVDRKTGHSLVLPTHNGQLLNPSGPQSPVSARSSSYPYTTVRNVLSWIPRHAVDKNDRLEGWEEVQGLLKGREIVLIIDDSTSMQPHWNDMKATIKALAYLTMPVVRDNIQLYFTSTPTCKFQSGKLTKLLNHFNNKKPSSTPCVVGMSLGQILNDVVGRAIRDSQPTGPRFNHLFKTAKAAQGVSVFVLTNGIWEARPDSLGVDICRVDDAILSIVETLVQNHKDRTFLSLQFIRFGHEAIGIRNLKYLDDEFGDILDKKIHKTGWDIIDTKFHGGSVWPMLMGSLSREDEVEDVIDTGASPTAPWSPNNTRQPSNGYEPGLMHPFRYGV